MILALDSHGKGKKTAMMAWRAVPEVTPVFLKLSHKPSEITEDDITLLEKFIVVMYIRTCNTETVNEARKILFAPENRTIDNIPPTKDALIQHTKRAVYQAGFVWAQSLTNQQVLPSPLEWGWKLTNGGWVPLWTTLPASSESCNEHCSCKGGCRGGCKCWKANLPCTALCKCGGYCHQDKRHVEDLRI